MNQPAPIIPLNPNYRWSARTRDRGQWAQYFTDPPPPYPPTQNRARRRAAAKAQRRAKR